MSRTLSQSTSQSPGARLSRGLQVACAALFAVGFVPFVAGLVASPNHAWTGLLLAGFFLLGPALGGLLFVALLHATKAGWATAILRLPEALARMLPLPLAAVGVVFLARPEIYPWWNLDLAGFKGWWLDPAGFLLRSAIYAGVWLAFLVLYLRRSRGGRRPVALSALFLVFFAFTFWLASFDWMMSFEYHWYSTIFGVYRFASLFTAALAATTIGALWLRRRGVLADVLHADHLHDLGKLLFAFTTFWAYTWFCQYMLIWYADLPEEAAFFTARAQGPWQPVFWAVFALHWAVPFLLLMTRNAKRRALPLVLASASVLLGAYLDLVVLILPALGMVPGPAAMLISAGALAGALGAGTWLFFHGLGRAPVVPHNDPYLAESLSYHS